VSSTIEDDARAATARWSSGTAWWPRLRKYASLKRTVDGQSTCWSAWIAGLDAVLVAELGGDGNPASAAQLGVNDMIHPIASKRLFVI
jgi:hypothetical protein